MPKLPIIRRETPALSCPHFAEPEACPSPFASPHGSSTIGLLLLLATRSASGTDSTQTCADVVNGHVTIPEGITKIADVRIHPAPSVPFTIHARSYPAPVPAFQFVRRH